MSLIASNIYDLLDVGGKGVNFLEQELSDPANQSLISARSITPHQAILGILIKKDSKNLIEGLKAKKRKVLVTQELRQALEEKVPEEIADLCLKLKDTVES